MNLLLPRARHPQIFAVIFSSLLLAAGGVLGETTNTALLTVQIVGNGTVNPNYNNQLLIVGQSYSMTAQARSGFTFIGWTGSQTNGKAKLTFVMTNGLAFTATFVDRQKPALTVTTPPNSGALTNPVITITGKARDNDDVAYVSYQLINSQNNGPDWQTASTGNGWSNWWANLTLAPYTNTLLAYAVDRSGNVSGTNKLNMTYSAAPVSLNGMTMTVTRPDNSLFVLNFGSGTFSENTGVGSFSYQKTGPVAGKLSYKYSAPPSATATSNNVATTLQFTDADHGTFIDDNGQNLFSLSTADTLAPPVLTGSQITLTSSNADSKIILDFLTSPPVVDNGNLFQVSNPLVISLSSQYPGEIGDRVKVTFTHLQYVNGSWVTVAPQIDAGTVIGIGTNTVTILFDKASFISKTDMFGPTAGLPLNIVSYYYTNDFAGVMTNGTGTFNYTNYSPAGALLQLSQSGTSGYYILTFTSASDSGNYYVEYYGGYGNLLQSVDAGSFGIELPPQITSQPQAVAAISGGTATLGVAAAGTPPLAFQWQFNGIDLTDGPTGSGSTISGSITTNLTISSVSSNDIGNYQVVVTNIYGTVTSSVAALSITPISSLVPQIAGQPQSQSVTNGGIAQFSVTIVTETSTPTFQWQFSTTATGVYTNLIGASPFLGAQTLQLTITPVSPINQGYYQVIISNNYGSVTSNPALLFVQ